MQGVIINSKTRLGVLTKPTELIKIANKPLIEHLLDSLDGIISSALIITTKETEEEIKKKLQKYTTIKISYACQKQDQPTPSLLNHLQKKLEEKFFLINSSTFYKKEEITSTLEFENCMLTDTFPSTTPILLLNKKIFNTQPKKGSELIDWINDTRFTTKLKIRVSDTPLEIKYAWDLLTLNEILLKKIRTEYQSEPEKNATIKGELQIGKNTQIKNGTYIEGNVTIGKNCIIGPNCYIRGPTSIGDNCSIGNAVEIKSSILMDNVKISHLSYIGDSIIGENVNVGAGTITANLRHDKKTISYLLGSQKIDTKRKKLGAIIGENSSLGIHTSIYPGRSLPPNSTTTPGEIVK
ncbi:hypothetical protein HY643_04975 [Candidatus Woesearchaeota archaeon]|nr:hypothetical protein [Candidatus Woesearchaeota archaeon]